MPNLTRRQIEALRELTYNVLNSLATDGESDPPTDDYHFWQDLHEKLGEIQCHKD